MRIVLLVIGWFGIALAVFNSGVKIFGSAEEVARYAGSNRNLDTNFTVLAFCLIFLGLAAILNRISK